MANDLKHEQTHHHGSPIGRWVVRLWALVLLVTVLWSSVWAFGFLFTSIFEPAAAPERFTEEPAKLDVESIRSAVSADAPVKEHQAPLDRFHGLGSWTPPRVMSGCATSGCHDPLPHTKNKAVRAFANMHAMFLDCRVCHDEKAGVGSPVQWVDTRSGQAREEPPAIMRLIVALNPVGDDAVATDEQSGSAIVELLRETLADGGPNAQLSYNLVQLETTQADSPVWRQTIDRLRRDLPGLARGEYGAVLTLLPSVVEDVPDNAEMVSLAQRYLAMEPETDGYQKLFDSMHERIVAEPSACFACHGAEDQRLDLAKLGYWPDRVDELRRLPLARLVERVRSGEPFHLPSLLETEEPGGEGSE